MLIITKIHKSKYIEDMYENEYLYFSSLKSFRNSAIDNTGRLDPRELNLKNLQLKKLTIIIKENEIPLHENAGDFNAQYMEHLSHPEINCCSLHWLEIKPGFPPSTINTKLLEMGDKSLLIYNCRKFFDILDSSLKNMGLHFSRKKVKYYNPKKFNGDITLHHKDELFSWQNEYRILISPTDNKPIKLPLKGLKEICCVVETKNLKKLRVEIEN